MDQQTIVAFVDNWRNSHQITGTDALNTSQLTQFAQDLQAQVAQVEVGVLAQRRFGALSAKRENQ